MHPTGNPNVRAALRGLERHGLQPVFWTSIAFSKGLTGYLHRFPGLGVELERRCFPEVPASRVRTVSSREVVRQIAKRAGIRFVTRRESGWASVDRVYQALDRAVARSLRQNSNGVRLVYAYEDGARESFVEAQGRGLQRVYELPIAYWRTLHAILREERERCPDWAVTIEALRDSPEKLRRKDEELALADVVVVPSRFAARSLELAPTRPRRVEIAPYGCPAPRPGEPARRRPSEPLRILYAGHLRQHKGISYLFEAIERISFPYELTLAGPGPNVSCSPLVRALEDTNSQWLGSMPHSPLLEEMARHHVFVFPSLAEGFGLVITEALSAGLPVIATTNTCAPEILRNGVEGFVVPIRDPDAIAEHLTYLYEHEDERHAMAMAAKERAAELSWRRFEDRVAEIVRRAIAE